MHTRRGLILLFLLLPLVAAAQVNRYGIPFMQNYSTAALSYAEQNWAVVQDSRGVMYFGNNEKGVLVYDGENWRNIALPNGIDVRSLAIDSLDRIFVGAVNEYGVLLPDRSGKLCYHSLSARMDSSIQDQILKTYVFDNKVFFCSSQGIAVYDYKTVKRIKQPSGSFQSFVVEKYFFIGANAGLYQKKGAGWELVPGGEAFKGMSITSIQQSTDGKLIITTLQDGVFLYDPLTGKISPYPLSAWTKRNFKESLLYNSSPLPGSRQAFASLGKGIIVINKDGEGIDQCSRQINGLLDDWVSSVYFNSRAGTQSPIWASLNNGLAKVEINSPLRHFGEESGITGQVMDIIRFKGTLYIATMNGVFYLESINGESPVFLPIESLADFQTWALLNFKVPGSSSEILLIGTFKGLFELTSKDKVRRINFESGNSRDESKEIYVNKLFQSKNDPSRVIIGSDGVHLMQYKAGLWIKGNKVTKIAADVRSIAEDEMGNIWLGSYVNGLIRMKIKGPGDTLRQFYNEKHGLPQIRDIHVFMLNKKAVFATASGLYQFNEDSLRFYPDSSFGARYADGSRGVFQIQNPSAGLYWFLCYKPGSTSSWLEKASQSKEGSWTYESQLFKRLPKGWSDVIYSDENNITWMGLSTSLFSYNPAVKVGPAPAYNTLIRSVSIGQDSTIFFGDFVQGDSLDATLVNSQPKDMQLTFPYRLNNISFTYAAPFFENEDANEYSYYLEGLSSSWSKWSLESKIPFNNLGEGSYTFKVKARNVYGVESTVASYSFRILPPWYRTIVAFILYLLLLGIFVWGLVKYNTRRLQLEKIRLEALVQERTAEVVKQKEEIEAQRDEIIAQKKDITDSIRYASRIQRAVLPSEKMLNEQLPEHFVLFKPRDIVSGDFYWMTQREHLTFIVVADCTGHGVPGAFMSMLGMSFLNEIVNKSTIEYANLVLNDLREHVITQLKQTGKEEGETKDGMDLSLIIIDKKNKKIQFAGANNPLYLVRPLTAEEKANPMKEEELPRGNLRSDDHELVQVNADKMPIGISAHLEKSFSNTVIDIEENISLYISSDGYEDQFGGPNGKKFLSKSLKRLILKQQGKPMAEQRRVLDKTIEDWRGELEQVDDILMMGVRIS